MKGEIETSLHCALEIAPKSFFQEALKTTQKGEEKDAFDVVVQCPLDGVIKCSRESAPKDALNDLHKDAREATITFESKQNIVNVLNFQLLLIMFNLPTKQAISRGAAS